jgi:hypothetical protein
MNRTCGKQATNVMWCLMSELIPTLDTNSGQRGLTRASVQIRERCHTFTLFGKWLCVYCLKFKRNVTWSCSPTTWYCQVLGVRDYRRGMGWILDLLTTWVHHSELQFTDNWHTQTNVLSLLVSTSRFLATHLTQWRFFSFPRSGRLFTAARAELLSTDNSTGS